VQEGGRGNGCPADLVRQLWPHPLRPAEQLKETLGGICGLWQGSSSRHPLGLPSSSYDHDRLVEAAAGGADLVGAKFAP